MSQPFTSLALLANVEHCVEKNRERDNDEDIPRWRFGLVFPVRNASAAGPRDLVPISGFPAIFAGFTFVVPIKGRFPMWICDKF